MDLENQIINIYNPQDFNRLCDMLFSSLWGEDYQQIDDDQSDGGNDGYRYSTHTLYAKHCFKRLPKRDSIAEIVKKAKSDLQKAKKLKDSGVFEIEQWTFVTPYKMPHDAWIEITQEEKKVGFKLSCIGPSFLASNLLDKGHLLSDFPFLETSRINGKLDTIIEKLDSTLSKEDANQIVQQEKENPDSFKEAESLDSVLDSAVFASPSPSPSPSPDEEQSSDYMQALSLEGESPTPENISLAKKIIYSSSDPEAVLQAIFTLTAWPRTTSNVEDMLTFIEQGITTAQRLKNIDAEAVLYAEKGFYLSMKFCLLDLEGWGKVEMTNISGYPVINKDEQEQLVLRLRELNNEFNKAFREAIDHSLMRKTPMAITRIFMTIAIAAGQRFLHMNGLGVKERAEFEKRVCKDSFLYAKEVASEAKDEYELAHVLYNFALSLKTFGEAREAIGVLNSTIEISTKLNLTDLLEKSISLKEEVSHEIK